jgi:hypothetical protein
LIQWFFTHTETNILKRIFFDENQHLEKFKYVTYLNDKFLALWTEKRKKTLKLSEVGVDSDRKVEKGAEDVRAWG